MLPADQYRRGLERLFRLDPSFTSNLWLLTHADLRNVARVRALSQFLFEALRGIHGSRRSHERADFKGSE